MILETALIAHPHTGREWTAFSCTEQTWRCSRMRTYLYSVIS